MHAGVLCDFTFLLDLILYSSNKVSTTFSPITSVGVERLFNYSSSAFRPIVLMGTYNGHNIEVYLNQDH